YVQQIGTPLELYDKPANLFVAGFIGLPSMNFIDLKVNNGMLENENMQMPLREEQKELLRSYEGKNIILGVRPEDVTKGEDLILHVFSNENLGQNTQITG